jgi:hypothetical protein
MICLLKDAALSAVMVRPPADKLLWARLFTSSCDIEFEIASVR